MWATAGVALLAVAVAGVAGAVVIDRRGSPTAATSEARTDASSDGTADVAAGPDDGGDSEIPADEPDGGADGSDDADDADQRRDDEPDDGADGAGQPPDEESGTDDPVADPARISIPDLDIASNLLPVGLDADGALEVPGDPDQAGWRSDEGPKPGDPGPAIIVGQGDPREGRGVFADLPEIEVDDRIRIEREDGSRVTFRVDRVEQYPQDEFPTTEVYGSTPDPELRVVTSGGEFDADAGRYRDNVVVFASLEN